MAIATVMAIIAGRTENTTVQIVLIVGGCVVVIAFFIASVVTIKILGPYALLSATQVVTYRRLEMASKKLPSIPLTGEPVIGEGDASPLAIPEGHEEPDS